MFVAGASLAAMHTNCLLRTLTLVIVWHSLHREPVAGVVSKLSGLSLHSIDVLSIECKESRECKSFDRFSAVSFLS